MDRLDASDDCSVTTDSDQHIVELAYAEQPREIEALYSEAAVDQAHSALIRCRRHGCCAHDNVGGESSIAMLGELLARMTDDT